MDACKKQHATEKPMKKLILAAAALIALGTTAQAQETVRIATEGAYAPWNFLDD